MKRLFLLSTILLLPSFFFLAACDKWGTDCNCPPIQGAYFRTTGLDAEILEQSGTNAAAAVADGTGVLFDQMRITLNFDVEYYSVSQRGFDLSKLAPSTYACSCISNGDAGSEERMESINITTVYDIDSSHPAGSNINDLLIVSQFNQEIDVDDLPNFQLFYPDFQLRFKERLPLGDFAFKAEIKMLDGTLYAAESVNVRIE
jgi:hypothetical protein